MSVVRHVVRVDLPETPYEVRIEPGLLARAGEVLASLTGQRRVGIITDDAVSPLHCPPLKTSLEGAGFEVITHVLPSGEAFKTIDHLLPAYDTFLSARFERSTPIIALGGGVVGDMGGFVAATLLRGVPLIQMPTTLLSMVDASVGGKTGVDHAAGKNLIGAFHQPTAVLIDPQTLTTLAARQVKSGLAECIKHDLIRDAEGFAALEHNIEKVLSLNIGHLSELVAHNVQIKARVVMADPFERGERAHLNFGHTFGHAIETVSQYNYTHGEAISLGMCAALSVAEALRMIDPSATNRVRTLLGRAGLPTGKMTLDADAILSAMYSDKKVKSGRLRFVLPDRIGHVVMRDDVSANIVRAAIESLRS
jgi:3-dehydroquinate synthase